MQLIIGDLFFFDVKTSSRRFAERWDLEQKFHVMVLEGGFFGGMGSLEPLLQTMLSMLSQSVPNAYIG